jgi:N-methylhydantoinase B
MTEIQPDGRIASYVPPKDPPEAIRPMLHQESVDVDPTTFEVLRHALWNVIVEHGTTITRTSGSVAVVHAHDFNPVILDEWGDFVYIGPWLQYLVAASPPAVKWTMENRHPRPGIDPGSMFLSNDPWIGATHQSDVALLAPVFVDGRIFAWVANSLHHADLGGTSPGGFNPVAPDIFSESGVIPPIRLVENGEIRVDLEDEFLRRSRMPAIVGVDLRAQVAGCRVAVERLQHLIDRHRPEVIKGVMRKIQDDAQAAFVKRLESIPDGEWSEEAYLERATADDPKVYRNVMTLRKRGDRLEFSNEGTDPQIGTICCTLPAWIGGIAAMVNTQLMFDQMFAVGGALRQIDFKAESGSITSALHPSPVSLAVLTVDQCIALAGLCISKMLSCSSDPELRKEAQSSMGTATFPVAMFAGSNAAGEVFAAAFTEPLGAGMAAWPFRDGIDAGGWSWDPLVAIPNVEEMESFYPILYLWRRFTPDSGGAGRYRGGNGLEVAAIKRGVDVMQFFTASAGHHALPLSPLYGGYQSDVHHFGMFRDTDVHERFAGGSVPSAANLNGRHEVIPAKAFGVDQGPDDVFVMRYCGAGGYGDPLLREPQHVARDVALGRVTAGEAERLYGVVFRADGTVDESATGDRRDRALAERRGWNRPPGDIRTLATNGTEARVLGPDLVVGSDGDGDVMACRCGTVMSELRGNWKAGAAWRDIPVPEGNRWCPPTEELVDDEFVLRQYACPGCGRLIDSKILRPAEPGLWDMRIEEAV